MKKLMIMFVAMAMAVCANAASVTWVSGGLVDHTGTLLAKSADYTAQVYFFADAFGTTDISTDFAGTLTVSKSTKMGIYSENTKSTGIASGTYYAQLMITGNEGGAGEGWSLTSEIASFTYDATKTTNHTINFLDGTGFDTATEKYSNSGINYGWVKAGGGTDGVPEPTSGLLLLVGMGALALRRKQK